MRSVEEKRAQKRSYYLANREKFLKCRRAYYEANKEKCIADSLARIRANPKLHARYSAIWYSRRSEESIVKEKARRVARNAANPERQRENKRRWVRENPEKLKEQRERGAEAHKAARRRWNEANPEKVNAKLAKRRAKKLGATPAWLSDEQLNRTEAIYEAARMLSERSTMEPHEVDHIVPLLGKRVCGLHVPWNLQILTAEENGSKSNYLPPADQLVDYSAKGYAGVRAKLKGKANNERR